MCCMRDKRRVFASLNRRKHVAKLTSGRSYAVILIFDVPPQVVDGQEAMAFIPAINVGLGVMGQLKVTTGEVSKDDPEVFAKRLLGPVLA